MPDREKIISEIEDALSDNLAKAGYIYGLSLNGLKDKALTDVLTLLKEQEAVVRCRDCKRRGTYDCPVYVGGDGMYSEPDNWYCADGERKG